MSLPDDVAGSPFVTSVLGVGDQEIRQDVTSRVMLSSEEYEEVVASEGLAGMYMDPKLSRIQKEYGLFLRDMEKEA